MKAIRWQSVLFIFFFAFNSGCAGKTAEIKADSVPIPIFSSPVKIKTHLLIGKDYQEKNTEWRKEVTAAFQEVNKQFLKEKIPVFLEIVEIDTKTITPFLLERLSVKGGSPLGNLTAYFYWMYSGERVMPPKDIAIIIIRQKHHLIWGSAYLAEPVPHVAAVSRLENCKNENNDCFPYFVGLIMHEVGHLLDARDLKEENERKFLMSGGEIDFDEPPRFLIDEKNRLLILEALKKYYQ